MKCLWPHSIHRSILFVILCVGRSSSRYTDHSCAPISSELPLKPATGIMEFSFYVDRFFSNFLIFQKLSFTQHSEIFLFLCFILFPKRLTILSTYKSKLFKVYQGSMDIKVLLPKTYALKDFPSDRNILTKAD